MQANMGRNGFRRTSTRRHVALPAKRRQYRQNGAFSYNTCSSLLEPLRHPLTRSREPSLTEGSFSARPMPKRHHGRLSGSRGATIALCNEIRRLRLRRKSRHKYAARAGISESEAAEVRRLAKQAEVD